MPPFFSIVIPTNNRASLIKDALDSILQQTVADYEVVVVDNGSTDDTVAVVTSFAAKFSQPLRILQQPDLGPGDGRNNGIRHSAGRYVAFLDSDDIWFPWTLDLFQRGIAQFDQPAFVCGTPIVIRPGDQIRADGDQELSVERHADFYSVPGNPFYRFTTSGVAVRKSSLGRVGGFATEGLEDLDMWMRLGTEPGFLLITSPPIVVRRLFGGNLSDSRENNRSGSAHMIRSEKTGRYPGGRTRQADRRRLLTVLMRALSVQMARSRDYTAALSVYSQILFWSLAQLRIRYLLGLPMLIISRMIKARQ